MKNKKKSIDTSILQIKAGLFFDVEQEVLVLQPGCEVGTSFLCREKMSDLQGSGEDQRQDTACKCCRAGHKPYAVQSPECGQEE